MENEMITYRVGYVKELRWSNGRWVCWKEEELTITYKAEKMKRAYDRFKKENPDYVLCWVEEVK